MARARWATREVTNVAGPVTMPPDAAEKAAEKAKTTDYYENLTDEERAEEGLPAREAPKGDPEPAAKPDPEPEPEPDAGEPEPDEDGATGRLFEEIAAMREGLSAALGKPDSAPRTEKEDPLLSAALEHDDPVVRGMAERLQSAEKRLEATETDARNERIARQFAQDTADFDAVKASYVIGGKPMTDAQVEAVENYMLKNPEVGSRLTIEQATRVVFPDAAKVGRKAAPAKEDGSKAATIVDEGSAGGASAGPWKPRPNETIESAVAEAGRRLFNVKR